MLSGLHSKMQDEIGTLAASILTHYPSGSTKERKAVLTTAAEVTI